MKGFFGGVGIVVLVVGGIVGLAFGAPYLRLQVMRMYGTELESVKTDIYRENKAYVEGTVRDLRDLRREYKAANAEHRDAVKDLILHRAGELDWDRLPGDLRDFLNELEGE